MDRTGNMLGVDRQLPPCLALCERRGWQPIVYTDNDLSATYGKRRPEYERMLTDVQNGTLSAVVCLHNDRLLRSPRELEGFISVVEDRAIVATVQSGDYDLTTPTGRAYARIGTAMARMEVEHKGERQVLANQQRAAAGKAHGGPRCYGYGRGGKEFASSYTMSCWRADGKPPHGTEIHVDEAQVLRDVARHIAAGETTRSQLADLNRRGILSATGKRWSQTVLVRLLRNPRIAGLRSYKGQITKAGTWPAVIGEDDWRRLQARLRVRDHGVPLREGTTSKYLLLGVLRCGRCGAKLGGRPRTTGKAGRKIRTYICRGGPEGGCGGIRVVAEAVEELVQAAVVATLNSKEFQAARRRRQQTGDTGSAFLEVQRLASKLEELAASFGREEFSFGEWQAVRTPLEVKLKAARATLDRLERDASQSALVDVSDLAGRWGELSFDRRRSVVLSLVAAVKIAPAPARTGGKFDPSRVTIGWRV